MLSGYNCTIFAYGQTGTGKTYTMSGDMDDTLGILSDNAGIIPRVLYSLFHKLEETESTVKCSFIELYNEELRDLLSPEENTKLKIFDNEGKKGHNGSTLVQGMEESHIASASAGIRLLQQGSHRRQVAATKCNDLSSRSHTVFTITVYIKRTTEGGEEYISSGKLNLVDLAGSENIQRSGAENKRATEAGLINKSLLTLGRVINALVDKSPHIPYRSVQVSHTVMTRHSLTVTENRSLLGCSKTPWEVIQRRVSLPQCRRQGATWRRQYPLWTMRSERRTSATSRKSTLQCQRKRSFVNSLLRSRSSKVSLLPRDIGTAST